MFNSEDDASRREKCYTTVTQLPAYVDPKQPPTKKSPFSTILGHPFVHTVRRGSAFHYVSARSVMLTGLKQVEVILPEALYSSIGGSLDSKLQKPRYARVFVSLASLLEEDFFNAYIKIGT